MQITVPVVPTLYTGWDKSKAFKLCLDKVNLGFETWVSINAIYSPLGKSWKGEICILCVP